MVWMLVGSLLLLCCHASSRSLGVEGQLAGGVDQGQQLLSVQLRRAPSSGLSLLERASAVRDESTNLVLGGNIWPTGGFWTMINVGSPPQPQQVQIDTGSSDLIIAGSGCKECGQPRYDQASSRTSKSVSCATTAFHCAFCSANLCNMNNTYQTCDYSDPSAACSLLGPCAYDTVTIGNFKVPNVGFGIIAQQTGAFDNEWTNMAGVMGLGYPSLSGVWLNRSLFTSLRAAYPALADVFSMCLSDQGGILTFGGYDPRLFSGALQYTPITTKQWYVLEWIDLGVAGKSVGLPSSTYNRIANGTILDSGTNTLVVAGEAYPLVAALVCAHAPPISGLCDANKGIFAGGCFAMTQQQVDAFPPVYVKLRGTDHLELRGRDYLLLHPEKDLYCMGIQSSGAGGFSILGNVFQHRWYTVFDRANSRVGFALANDQCVTTAGA
jgi:hypothetical protein